MSGKLARIRWSWPDAMRPNGRARCAFLHKAGDRRLAPERHAHRAAVLAACRLPPAACRLPLATECWQAGEGSENRLPVLRQGVGRDVLPSRDVKEGGKSVVAPSIEQGECHGCTPLAASIPVQKCAVACPVLGRRPFGARLWVTRYRLKTSAMACALSARVCAKTRLRSRMDCSASSMKRLAVSYWAFASSFNAR